MKESPTNSNCDVSQSQWEMMRRTTTTTATTTRTAAAVKTKKQFNNYRSKRQRGGNKCSSTEQQQQQPLRLDSMDGSSSSSTNWRRRRRRGLRRYDNTQNDDNAIKRTTAAVHHDNCNYAATTVFNKINKYLLITMCMLLITTTTTICQSNAAAMATTSASSSEDANSSPLSALLKSGGASYNLPTQRQLQQQQLFAMLTKNSLIGGNGGGGGVGNGNANGIAPISGVTARRNFMRLHSDDDDDDDVDTDTEADAEFTSAHIPRDISASASATGQATVSLENGFVADDGGQYEEAQRALAAAAAASSANPANNNCPKECKCLDVFFDCDKLHLERVPLLPNYVQTLQLVGNKLNDTSVLDIRNLPDLHKLWLKRNQLDVMPIFVGLTSLKQLNLAHNRIQVISKEALMALPKLKSLDLSKNRLHTLEDHSFVKPNRLAHLILNSNEISSVHEHAFANLNDLIDLELNNNRLLNLPLGVFKSLGRLKKLSLNNNYLEINWSTFRGLLSLQRLQLKANKIRALQDGVFHVMRNIEMIELDHNGISSLSRQGLFNLTKLHHLSLSNNSISRIEPDTWEFTQSLESLDLSHNNISEFKPQHLDCLQRLKHLNLAHNMLQHLQDNTFDCVKNLEELNLRRNRLAWIIEDQSALPPFKALRKLRKLDLYGNNLKQISSKALSGLSSLELLNLGGNALATIQPNAFEHTQRLHKLIFKSINFICDCELVWFRDWLTTRFAAQAQPMLSQVVCGYPEHLLDRNLRTLTNAELVCADSPKPALKQEPTQMLAVKGANITLECIASSPAAASLAAADELKIMWRHDNQLVQEHPAIHDSSSTETQIHHDQANNHTTIIGYLRLGNVSYESAGRYQCLVSNAFGTTYGQKFKISIGIHPSFLHTPSNLTIDAGETARLVCSATGDPMPEISLQKFGASDFPAAIERRLQVMREENAFLITNAKPSDSGIYSCTAESAAGEIKVNATLLVNDKPQPSIPSIHKEVIQGRTCVLECISETINVELEQPHREWFKEHKPLHISPTMQDAERFYFTAGKELLVIRNAQSSDAGNYRCEITDNSRTMTLQSDLLVVKENLNLQVVLLGAVLLTVACVMIGSCIVWCTLRYQRRKQQLTNDERLATRINASQNILCGSRASALDQTQLTTLNRTLLRPHQSQVIGDAVGSPPHRQMRPRSLADLGTGDGESVGNRLIVTTTPSYEQRCLEEGITLSYLQQNELVEQQDQLSSKDSGTGSDAAAKRSLEDFSMPNLHTSPGTNATRQLQHNLATSNNENSDADDDDDVDDDEDENELQFGPSRALGVSDVYDDLEMYELNCNAAEQQRFLRNNNHSYDGGGAGDGGGGNSTVPITTPPPVLPRKCGTQLNNHSYGNAKKSTTVDI